MPEHEFYDVIIAGAGIIGCLTAREFTRFDLRVLVIDRAWDIGTGASGANSAILHSGYDPIPGGLKAEMNVRGNRLWDDLAHQLDIPMKRTGSFVVAVGEQELPALDTLMERAIRNGVPGVKLISRDDMRRREPLIHPSTAGAFFTPSAGVCDPFRAVVAAAESAAVNGAEFLFGTEVTSIRADGGKTSGVESSAGFFLCGLFVNCAGIDSARLMHTAGVRPEFSVEARRGEYLILDPAKISLNHVYFPVPTQKGKGCLVSTTTHGNVMIGPNANTVTDPADTSVTREGIEEIVRMAKKLIPSIEARDAISEFAGIRATGNLPGRDFLIESCETPSGFINLGGIDSPGLVSAPAIAQRVVELAREAGIPLRPNPKFIPELKAAPVFRRLPHKEKAELIARAPLYGRIVCRCEEITEGEVVAAIHSPVPAKSYDAVKRRTWLGTGRCQGGFDCSRVIEILARELKIPVTEVTKKGKGSEIVFRMTKDASADGRGGAR